MDATIYFTEDGDGWMTGHIATRADIDRADNLAANAAKRVILKRRAEEFTARSIFEFVMHIDEADGSRA